MGVETEKTKPLTLTEVAENEGYSSWTDMFDEYLHEGIVPSVCPEGCQIEMDGTCEHGHQSIISQLMFEENPDIE